MKNPTFDEIIRAMEYCCGNTKQGDDEECTEKVCYQCALPEDRNGDIRWCRHWLIKDALDLIMSMKSDFKEDAR